MYIHMHTYTCMIYKYIGWTDGCSSVLGDGALFMLRGFPRSSAPREDCFGSDRAMLSSNPARSSHAAC